ncbi:MAG: hypothetical protein BWY71_01831 [Planctomycetes bacterium ADurb.Bin412]|nr:MAG: hypothetical protein BWY71_01831 [Planctomycetes bacterium ADurb.Bin412]
MDKNLFPLGAGQFHYRLALPIPIGLIERNLIRIGGVVFMRQTLADGLQKQGNIVLLLVDFFMTSNIIQGIFYRFFNFSFFGILVANLALYAGDGIHIGRRFPGLNISFLLHRH